MTKKKQLSDEQLDKVTGGCNGTDGINTNGQFSDFVNMYALHDQSNFGKEFYFVRNTRVDGNSWFRAKLVNSYEAWNWFSTDCTHDVRITEPGNYGYNKGRAIEIDGDLFAAYKTRNY